MKWDEARANEYTTWFSGKVGKSVFTLEENAIKKVLPKVEDAKDILDVGCGSGQFFTTWKNLGYKITGVDYSAHMLEKAEEKAIATRLLEASADDLPFEDNSFDVVSAITLLEFVSKPSKVINEITRVAKNSILLGVLGKANIQNFFRARRNDDTKVKYSRFFSYSAIKKLLKAHGYNNIKCAYAVYMPNWAYPAAFGLDKVMANIKLPFSAFAAIYAEKS